MRFPLNSSSDIVSINELILGRQTFYDVILPFKIITPILKVSTIHYH